MLIRVKGYNDGGKEYLEEGKKNGRDLTREELDDRVILYGDLDLTQMIYRQIPDKGQERYVSFTLSFREEYVANETLLAITQEFKDFLMYAYEAEEYNFYAEAHIPKIKFLPDQKTGKMIERKPHIHILVPRKNLLSGREMNPSGWFDSHVSYFEAFQEYINQKYQLQSPREHVRINPTNAAEVLSRYKGDDFLSK
ncbi:MAG TPA: molybdopterin-guanine dinucleotide biosynthesis protein MobB, partial [Arsenophonus nasoniae]